MDSKKSTSGTGTKVGLISLVVFLAVTMLLSDLAALWNLVDLRVLLAHMSQIIIPILLVFVLLDARGSR